MTEPLSWVSQGLGASACEGANPLKAMGGSPGGP